MDEVVNSLILLFVILIASIIMIIIVHELGHMIFGFLSGYHFLLFRIWKLAAVITGSRLKFFIVKKPYSFGQCIMIPPKIDKNPRIMMYGGIIFNLLFGCLLLAASTLISNYVFQNMSRIMGSLNLISAIFNYASKYMTDDGQSIRDMKCVEDIVYYNCQLIIAEHLVNGDSYIDMDGGMFVVENISLVSSYYEKEMYLYGYYRLLELGCFEMAEERIYRLEELDVEGWLADEVRKERIFFYNLNYNGDKRINYKAVTPSDVRINNPDAGISMEYSRYLYPGEVKSTKIILENIRNVPAVKQNDRGRMEFNHEKA